MNELLWITICFIIVLSDLWVINTLYQGNILCILLCFLFFFLFVCSVSCLCLYIDSIGHSFTLWFIALIIDYQILFTLFLHTWSELLVLLVNMIKEDLK